MHTPGLNPLCNLHHTGRSTESRAGSASHRSDTAVVKHGLGCKQSSQMLNIPQSTIKIIIIKNNIRQYSQDTLTGNRPRALIGFNKDSREDTETCARRGGINLSIGALKTVHFTVEKIRKHIQSVPDSM